MPPGSTYFSLVLLLTATMLMEKLCRLRIVNFPQLRKKTSSPPSSVLTCEHGLQQPIPARQLISASILATSGRHGVSVDVGQEPGLHRGQPSGVLGWKRMKGHIASSFVRRLEDRAEGGICSRWLSQATGGSCKLQGGVT